MSKRPENPPLFPAKGTLHLGENRYGEPIYGQRSEPGISLRDWFAGQAISIAVELQGPQRYEGIGKEAYALADALLSEREKG